MFTQGGHGGKVPANNFVDVFCVCLYVFDTADDCSHWVVECVERFLVYCLVALSVFLCLRYSVLSVIAVQYVYR